MFLEITRQGENQWWRYLLTLLLVVAGTLVGQLPLFLVAMANANTMNLPQSEWSAMLETLDFAGLGLDPNGGLALVLLSFICGLGGLAVGVRYLHRRLFRTLITPLPAVNWQKIIYSFALWMGLCILSEVVFYLLHPENYSLQFEAGPFLLLLMVAILLLPFQTSFEELLFRGYLMQGIGLLTPFRWIPMVATGLAFGMMHYMNPEVKAFGPGLAMTYYIGTGLFLGFVTLMDDSLELPLGIHAATNIFGALFVTFDASALQTAALFRVDHVSMPGMLAAFIAAAILYTFMVSKKYKWADWSRWYRRRQTQQITAL